MWQWTGHGISLFFFPAVVVSAIYGGYGPAALATVLSIVSQAYFFVEPYNSFNIGFDDVVRLSMFVAVAVATASLSSARQQAEAAQKASLLELQHTLDTLRKVSGWPVLIDMDQDSGATRVLEHAAGIVGASGAIAIWEAGEEPWMYMATPASEVVTRHPPGHGPGLETAALPSAPFQTENLSGRVFFAGLPDVTADLMPVIDLIAREVGNSLDQLHVATRLKQFAIQEDRIGLARDLHDGVLQSLTGVRLELQAMAGEGGGPSSLQDRLLAMERAIAIEQRELRLFIQGIKPAAGADVETGAVARSLGEISRRIALEWKVPVFIRVEPPELSLPAGAEHALRLMVHEAVVNALRHAHPSRVSVSFRAEGADVHVVVADDGRGFAFKGRLEHEALARANAGPVTLRERVTALGGRMAVESTASGSRIELTFPATV